MKSLILDGKKYEFEEGMKLFKSDNFSCDEITLVWE